jgi:hypothetical protein
MKLCFEVSVGILPADLSSPSLSPAVMAGVFLIVIIVVVFIIVIVVIPVIIIVVVMLAAIVVVVRLGSVICVWRRRVTLYGIRLGGVLIFAPGSALTQPVFLPGPLTLRLMHGHTCRQRDG